LKRAHGEDNGVSPAPVVIRHDAVPGWVPLPLTRIGVHVVESGVVVVSGRLKAECDEMGGGVRLTLKLRPVPSRQR
jgi:hypothetical protein